MSVANILKTPIVAPAITIPYASGGGGPPGPGLYLPLAGGVMDALPAGTITAHTIDGIATLTGIGASAPGNTFVIQTDPVGDNILIDASPSSGTVDIIGLAASITTQTNVEIEGRVVIQPPVGYTYPLVPQLGGLHIKNWNNTNATPGNTMIACEIDTISAIEDARGITVANVTSTAANSTGADINNISGAGQTAGISCGGITCSGQDALGLTIGGVTSAVSTGYGIYCANVAGGVSGIGAGFENISGPTAEGVKILTITATGDAKGIDIQSVDGASQAYGLQMNTVTSTGASFGVDITNIVGDGQVTGIQTQNITTTTGQAFGLLMNGIVGPNGANGITVGGVDAQTLPGSGAQATGIQVSGVNGDGSAYGMLLGGVNATISPGNGAPATGITLGGVEGDGQTSGMVMNKILGRNADPVRGIEMFDIRGIDLNAIGGNDVVGIEMYIIEDSIGSGNSTGISVSKVSNGVNNNSQSVGISVDNINNNVVKGVAIAAVNGAASGVGPDDSRGVDVDDITTATGECYGLSINKVSAGDGTTFGGPGRAFGINVDNITGTSRCFGIRVGPNLNAPAGIPLIGFEQRGGANKILNNFENEVVCGIAENLNTGQSLRIARGNAFYSAQYLTAGGVTITENGGNLIVLAGAGGYVLSLPSGNAQEGHQFTLCMTAPVAITLDAGGGIIVNGGISTVIPAAPAYKMYQAFYTDTSGVGQWYVG